jgi:hypothetical protein
LDRLQDVHRPNDSRINEILLGVRCFEMEGRSRMHDDPEWRIRLHDFLEGAFLGDIRYGDDFELAIWKVRV